MNGKTRGKVILVLHLLQERVAHKFGISKMTEKICYVFYASHSGVRRSDTESQLARGSSFASIFYPILLSQDIHA